MLKLYLASFSHSPPQSNNSHFLNCKPATYLIQIIVLSVQVEIVVLVEFTTAEGLIVLVLVGVLSRCFQRSYELC